MVVPVLARFMKWTGGRLPFVLALIACMAAIIPMHLPGGLDYLHAAPLICAGLGIAFAFRAGLFNVGAQGQAIVGAILAAWVGFAWRAPAGLHLALALLLGISGGAIWAGLAVT